MDVQYYPSGLTEATGPPLVASLKHATYTMLRKLKQWFIDGELAAVARDLDRVGDSVVTASGRLELLEGRFQRLQNRLQMRMARAELTGDRDAQILRDIQARRGNHEDDWEQHPPGDRDW